jgi:hypothetical protein
MLGKKVLNICSKKNKRGKELKDKIMSVWVNKMEMKRKNIIFIKISVMKLWLWMMRCMISQGHISMKKIIKVIKKM